MTTQELVALFALGVLWLNTLLVIGAALQSFRALGARRSRLRTLAPGETGVGLFVATVARGEPLARRIVEQIGRKAMDRAGRRAILFHDRGYRSELAGGALRVHDTELAVDPSLPVPRLEVWIDEAAMTKAATGEDAQFESAYAESGKARGHARAVVAELLPGTKVWAYGDRQAQSLRATPDGELLLSTLDPRTFCARRQGLLCAFIAGVAMAAAGCTILALWPPYFGKLSTLGGLLGLAYFLSVQPAGTWVRDHVRVPAVAILRGHWLRRS